MDIDSDASSNGLSLIDLTFVLDATGSMGSYLSSATKNIELIVSNIMASEKLSSPDSLRIALVHYRDHPPQDNSYVTDMLDFTSDIPLVKEELKKLYASGGGDGPEAVTAAMRVTLRDLSWRPSASKMAVLITDAPPHGIGEYGDGFVVSPDGEDPLQLAREMAAKGISLFVVACEPALSGYQYATDFFRAVTNITGAVMVPLTSAALLSHAIVGSAIEQMDMERLIAEVGQAIGEKIHGGAESVDDVAKELHEKLLLRQETTKQLVVESIHRDSEEARHNVEVFTTSANLAEAKERGLKKVIGSRFTDKYLQSRYTSSYARTTAYPSLPIVPPRDLPASTTGLVPPSSPPRKVIGEFKAFSAAGSMSMADTPLAATPAASHPIDDITQSIEMKFGAISLDQAKRITQSAAWRSAPPRA